MKRFFKRVVGRRLLVILVLFCSGCLGQSSPVDYYYLGSPAVEPGQSFTGFNLADREVLVVGPVTLPPELEQAGIASKNGSHRLTVSRTRVWAAPLNELIASALSRNLSRILGTDRVEVYPGRRFAEVRYQVDLEVIEFSGDLTRGFDCDIVWSVSDNNRMLTRNRFRRRISLAEEGYAGYVEAASRGLTSLAENIAETLSVDRVESAPAGDEE